MSSGPAPNNPWRSADPAPATLSVIVASGGGTRAASFLLGVLKTLDKLCLNYQTPDGSCAFTALDHVDIISTTSGSSLTAAYWAAKGKENFPNLEHQLINSGLGDIVLRFLHPESLIGGWFPARAQIDVLIDRLKYDDAFRGHGFGEATFGDLPPRPLMILNATDMGAKNTFAFTAQNFYFMCADLKKFPVAEAVAGSAAFPVVFGALSLRNYSYDRSASRPGDANICPSFVKPSWIDRTLNQGTAGLVGDRSEFRRADRLNSYATGDCGFREGELRPDGTKLPLCKEWLHLLDGGVVDNLGITEPLWLLTNIHIDTDIASPYATPYGSGSLKTAAATQVTQERDLIAASYARKIFSGEIKRIVILIANVRSNSEPDFEGEADGPGWITQALAVTGGSIDSVSDLLVAKVAQAENLKKSLKDEACELLNLENGNRSERRAACKLEKNVKDNIKNLKVDIVPLDFDLIGRVKDTNLSAQATSLIKNQRDEVRKYFQNLPTTWWLDKEDIEMLQVLPSCLLSDAEPVINIVDGLVEGNNDPRIKNEILPMIQNACSYDRLYQYVVSRRKR